MMINFMLEAKELFDYSQMIRRDLHMHPELGFQEIRTAGVVVRELNLLGLAVSRGVAKTGVVAVLDSGKPGRTIMLRFDMDALPIIEETGASYASISPGSMHACGHDAHVAIGLTVARLLCKHREDLVGSIKFVFQPAEEGLGGAEGMIKAGVLEQPRPDCALGIHVWNDAPLGWLGISPGAIMASSEIFTVIIHGQGGHAALPNRAIDPIMAAAQIIIALQSIVARNVNPLKTAVISATSIHGGQAFNVIPQMVEIKGTIRTFEPEIRELVIERFRHIVLNVADAMGCQAEIEMRSLTPALINDEYVTEIAQTTALNFWPDVKLDTRYATMGSEDMAFYHREIPGCFIFIGSANNDLGLNASHHHPKFDIDEKVLPLAAGLVASTAFALLEKGK
jgi:amidohydrolase